MKFNEKDEYIKKWIRNINPKNRTSLINQLREFCEFTERNPTELISDEFFDRNLNPIEQKGITERRVFEFFDFLQGKEINGKLREKPISYNSAITIAFGNISGFFAGNRVKVIYTKTLPRHKNSETEKNWYKNDNLVPISEYKELLKEIYDNLPSLRDKAIFLSELSSGLYSVDVFNLKVKDYKKGLDFCKKYSFDLVMIEGYRSKTDIPFCSFFSSETINIIEMYLKERKENLEKLTDDSYLFVSEKPSLINENGQVVERIYKKAKESAFRRVLQKGTEFLGIKGFTPKSLRDYFETMIESKIPTSKFNMYVGYKGNSEVRQYQLSEKVNGMEIYSKQCEPFLSISNSEKEIEKKFESKYETLEKKLEKSNEMIEILSQTIDILIESNPKAKKLLKSIK